MKKKANVKMAFSNIATIIRLHLMSYVDLLAFLKKPFQTWKQKQNNLYLQLNLFG